MCAWKILLCGLALGLALGILGLLLYQPRWLRRVRQWLFPGAVWEFERQDKVVALTFNNCPAIDGDAILTYLEESEAKATFFVYGCDVRPSTRQRLANIVHGGHELASHGWSSGVREFLDHPDGFERAFNDTEIVLRELQGLGDSASNGAKWLRSIWWPIPKTSADAMVQRGYQIVASSLGPPACCSFWPSFVAAHILHNVYPGGIIALQSNSHTLATLRFLIPDLRFRGYKIATLSEAQGRQEVETL